MHFSRPQGVSSYFYANLHPKCTVHRHFTAVAGHALKEAMRLCGLPTLHYAFFQGGREAGQVAGKLASCCTSSVVTKCDATEAVFSERSRDECLGNISWPFFLSPMYLEQHMARPTSWKTEVNNTDADFQMLKVCHKFPSVQHIRTNLSITCKPSELSTIVNGGCLQGFITLFYTGDILPKKRNKKLENFNFGGI
jgi:hypothetical protein